MGLPLRWMRGSSPVAEPRQSRLNHVNVQGAFEGMRADQRRGASHQRLLQEGHLQEKGERCLLGHLYQAVLAVLRPASAARASTQSFKRTQPCDPNRKTPGVRHMLIR